jgi:hypothetical protein
VSVFGCAAAFFFGRSLNRGLSLKLVGNIPESLVSGIQAAVAASDMVSFPTRSYFNEFKIQLGMVLFSVQMEQELMRLYLRPLAP